MDTFITLLSSTMTNWAAAKMAIGRPSPLFDALLIAAIVRLRAHAGQWRAHVCRGRVRTYRLLTCPPPRPRPRRPRPCVRATGEWREDRGLRLHRRHPDGCARRPR